MVVHKKTFKKIKKFVKKTAKKLNPFKTIRSAFKSNKKQARRPSRAKSVTRKRRPRRNRA